MGKRHAVRMRSWAGGGELCGSARSWQVQQQQAGGRSDNRQAGRQEGERRCSRKKPISSSCARNASCPTVTSAATSSVLSVVSFTPVTHSITSTRRDVISSSGAGMKSCAAADEDAKSLQQPGRGSNGWKWHMCEVSEPVPRLFMP